MTLDFNNLHWSYRARHLGTSFSGFPTFGMKPPCQGFSPPQPMGLPQSSPQGIFSIRNHLGTTLPGIPHPPANFPHLNPNASHLETSPPMPSQTSFSLPTFPPQKCSPVKSLMWSPEKVSPTFGQFSPGQRDPHNITSKRKYKKRTKLPECNTEKLSMASKADSLDNEESALSEINKCDSPDSTTVSLQKRIYSCSDCQYVTDRKNNLKRHIVTMHERCTKVLECCEKVFANKALLREHVRSCHSHGYDCKVCGRTFCRKALLKRHITVHSGQKDFVCGLCGYATSHKSNLDRHKRRHLPKHLRKPPYFTEMATAYGMLPNDSGSHLPRGPVTPRDGVLHNGAGLPFSLMNAYYNHSRQLRFGFHKYPSVKTNQRTPAHVRDSRMVKRKYTAFRKLMMLRYASRESSEGSVSSPIAKTSDEGDHQDTGCLSEQESCSIDTKSDDASAGSPLPIKSTLRLRLAPKLHKCKECDVVFTSQLALNAHIEEQHSTGPGVEPLRPLTLEARDSSRPTQHTTDAWS